MTSAAQGTGHCRLPHPPSRNNLSNANKVRDARFAELVFWRTLVHLQRCDTTFGRQRPGGGSRTVLHRFKVRVHAVDSTVMELEANCMNWAKHRRRKAAAKLHLRLGLNCFLPTFAIVDTAGEHDSRRAGEVCAGLQKGEVVVFDKAYVDFVHLHDLDARGVQWVTRAKDNLCCRPLRNLPLRQGGRVIKDQIVKLTGVKWQKFKGWTFRRVEAWVEVDGQERLMVFISNNTAWSAGSVCDLYRARWDIEVFFNQVKQTLKLGDFLGHKCQRHPLAGVVGPAGVCAALCGAHQPVGAQLHTPLCRGACGTLGSGWNSSDCCEVMGQQAAALPCWGPHTQRGSQALRRRPLQRMRQHRPDLPGKHARTATCPPTLSSITP